MRLPLACLLVLFAARICEGQGLDTLRTYSRKGGYVYYSDPAITAQAARFEVSGPAHVRSVVVTLGGPSANGSAVVHLYGHEGGLPAPGIGKDLTTPVRIKKTRAGVERITVNFPDGIPIRSHQFFISIDDIGKGVRLLSDRRPKRPLCVNARENYTFQAVRSYGDRWSWGEYSYIVDAIVEYEPKQDTKRGFDDVTALIGIPDSLLVNSSIAWADIDRDGYLDLLIDGKLYKNDHATAFIDISDRVGLSGQPALGFFIDANNDGLRDILTIISDSSATLSHATDDGKFITTPLNISVAPGIRSISIADADGDGYLDLFIGRAALEHVGGSTLLINDRHGDFIDRTATLLPELQRGGPVAGSQWVDADGDGDLDLFIARDDSTGGELLLRDSDGKFRNGNALFSASWSEGRFSGRIGCHWADYNNDGALDLLLPEIRSASAERISPQGEGAVLRRPVTSGAELVQADPLEYEEQRAGGAWGDVNNDGRLDMILTTSCGCRYAGVYEQTEAGSFIQKTFEYGLTRLAAGPDAIWVDFDNDGRLDLATIVDGRFKLFRNTVATPNNALELDIEGKDAVGALAEVFVRGARYTQQVTAGRGLLMEEPARLHFGVGPVSEVDSVRVRWANGHVDTYDALSARGVHRLVEGGGASGTDGEAITDLSVAPNPVNNRLHVRFTLQSAREIRLGIYTVQGELVKLLVDERRQAGSHDIVWETLDSHGERVAVGSYLYRLESQGREQTGRVVVVR